MKLEFAVALTLIVTGAPALAAEPDGLMLPPGFHAGVVAEGLGAIRHMAIRDNGDIYVSTRHGRDQASAGIIALRLGPDHKAAQTEHFSTVDQGTGIRIYQGALYAASGTRISHRFPLDGEAHWCPRPLRKRSSTALPPAITQSRLTAKAGCSSRSTAAETSAPIPYA